MYISPQGLYILSQSSANTQVWLLRPETNVPELLKTFPNYTLGSAVFYSSFQSKTAFVLENDSGKQIWVSNGTSGGTTLLKNISSGDAIRYSAISFTPDSYYYLSSTGDYETKLCRSEGTNESILYEIPNTESGNAAYGNLYLCNNALYIALTSPTNLLGYVHKYDINTGEKLLLKRVGGFTSSGFTRLENNVVFTAAGSNSSSEESSDKNFLFLSDGTVNGTRTIRELRSNSYIYSTTTDAALYPLSEKEILVSVVDEAYSQEWFTFRICKNETSLSGESAQSKTERTSTMIVSSEKLEGRGNVNYYAPKSITLNPGFTTNMSGISTGIFKAEIKNYTCNFRY